MPNEKTIEKQIITAQKVTNKQKEYDKCIAIKKEQDTKGGN